jgi:hypothetical protein
VPGIRSSRPDPRTAGGKAAGVDSSANHAGIGIDQGLLIPAEAMLDQLHGSAHRLGTEPPVLDGRRVRATLD